MSSMPLAHPIDRLPRGAPARESQWFVGLCIAVICASLAAVLYLQLDFSLSEAGWIGFAALLAIVLARLSIAKSRERRAFEAELFEVNEIAAGLQRQMVALNERIADAETALAARVDHAVDLRTADLTADLQVIEDSVRDLAASFAAYEAEQLRGPVPSSAGGRPYAAPNAAQAPSEGMYGPEAVAQIRRAIEENRIEVFLQPVVTLPQRRVRYYEALTRLRGDDGEAIMPADYIGLAEPAGLMPRIDNILLFRCVQIMRRMNGRSRELGIFCNLSAQSLVDEEFFPQFMDFMAENKELADSLIFELPQPVLEDLGPIEKAGLDSLIDLGFRLSVDHVQHLDIDGAAYADKRVRFVKIDADMLLNPPQGAAGQIHVADLARLLARSGIELIAGRIESEAALVDLLDYDIRLGQGYLFSQPRPIRGDFLGTQTGAADWARAS